jgi:hypothetical protein
MNKEWESRPMDVDKYYLVALPENKVLQRALEIQEEFSKRYGVYEHPFPPLHLTVGILYISDEKTREAAIQLLNPLLTRFLPFRLGVKGRSCFPPPYKSVNLRVTPSKKLRQISWQTVKTLEQAGIKCHPMDGWDYHISLVNTVFAAREWSEAEYLEACQLLGKEKISLGCHVRSIQLWSPQFPPLHVLHEFNG